jgi:hypothetical protein
MTFAQRALTYLGAIALVTSTAMAKPTDEAQRLIEKRHSERYRVDAPGSHIQAGAARIHVAAPIDVVRQVVTDFGSYSRHIKKFNKTHVVGKSGAKTDVYMQVPILKGLGKVWAIVRFAPPKMSKDGEEIIEGTMLKGNVKRLDAKVRLSKIDEENTLLNVELLIVPDLPVPGSVVTGEVAYAAHEAVVGLRNRSEVLRANRK